MKLIPAAIEHLDAICRITEQAKAQLARLGLDQWQRGYPNRDVWLADLDTGVAWVAVEDGEPRIAFDKTI